MNDAIAGSERSSSYYSLVDPGNEAGSIPHSPGSESIKTVQGRPDDGVDRQEGESPRQGTGRSASAMSSAGGLVRRDQRLCDHLRLTDVAECDVAF